MSDIKYYQAPAADTTGADTAALQARVTELEAQLQAAQSQVDTATQERDQAHEKLENAKQAQASGLPADALERLEAVNGISKALAQKAVDALQAPAGE